MLTLLNGVFALSEIALVSVKRHVIQQKAEEGHKRAAIVLKLLNNPESFLSSVQVGITLIGIVAGAYGAVELVDNVEPFFQNISFISQFSHELAFVVIISFITYFSIVLGELIPKSIALNNPEKIALNFGPFVHFFSYLTYPLIKLLSFSTLIVLKILRIEDNKADKISGEELVQMLKMADNQGVIEKEESMMHQNIFTFSEQRAKSLKTHRSEVEWIDIDGDMESITEQVKNSSYSKFPVCKNNVDNVVGVVTAKDFFEHLTSGKAFKDILKEPIFISEMMTAIDILRLFKEKKEYLGIVVDEYGSFEGILTLHDLIESIVGDLPEVNVDDEPELLKREDGTFLINGSMEIDTLNDSFEMELISENPENYMTLAGFIIYFLGRIPQIGETFEYNNYIFEIVDLDGNRIDKIVIKKI